MARTIIQVEELSKSFFIHHEGKEKYVALRDVISNKAKSIFSSSKKIKDISETKEEFWALKDLSFDIKQGDRVGIIGRNGAGKSTLLKILSRITEPTKGKVALKGRVASLLEVGTGFHPELTGRENIFLNGAILGMTRSEIRRKFAEIVEFAEIEKFLDTPVKRYSSGMYVRLAFAVAAHLEPEILVVDEVLAVGDAQFQKKCLGKMEDVSKSEGRTVLFVSHNMSAVQNLCSKGLYLASGRKIDYGNCSQIIEQYLGEFSVQTSRMWKREFTSKDETKDLYIDEVLIGTTNPEQVEFFISDQIQVTIRVKVKKPVSGISVEFFLRNIDTSPVFSSFTHPQDFETGIYEVNTVIPPNLLNNKHYYIDAGISKNFTYFVDNLQNLISFNILDDITNLGVTLDYIGSVRPLLKWTTNKVE